jgi:hypothetical protein
LENIFLLTGGSDGGGEKIYAPKLGTFPLLGALLQVKFLLTSFIDSRKFGRINVRKPLVANGL